MIKLLLKGGLGNQLFQYAAARSLSLDKRTSLMINTNFYKSKQRTYLLDHYPIAGSSNESGLDPLIARLIWAVNCKLNLRRRGPVRLGRYFIQGESQFGQSFFDLPVDTVLDGYFQSEKFFYRHRKQILGELKLREEHVAEIPQNLIQQASSPSAISLHIRRGDYLKKENADYLGVLSVQYYLDAISYVNTSMERGSFLVFSDDIDWAKANVPLRDAIYVSGTGLQDYQELYLMSLCRHHILSNSSFSWWGTYSSKSDGVVVAPKNWFADKKVSFEDIYQPDWIRL